jgi:hypothetical protein
VTHPDRTRALDTQASAAHPMTVIIEAHGTLVSDAEALVRAALGALVNMGKKTEEHWIPKDPAPWQKLAKDCDRELREEPINGGCWVEVVGPPPCGKLFRNGDKCYRPVAADPSKPVGAPVPEPTQEGPAFAPGMTNDGRGGRE